MLRRRGKRRVTKKKKEEAELLLGLVISPAVTMSAATTRTAAAERPSKRELADLLAHTTLPEVLEAILPPQMNRDDIFGLVKSAIRADERTEELKVVKKELERLKADTEERCVMLGVGLDELAKKVKPDNTDEIISSLKRRLDEVEESYKKRALTEDKQIKALQARLNAIETTNT